MITLSAAGDISRFYGPYGKSMECYRKALQVTKEAHNRKLEGVSYFFLGKELIDRQQYEEAARCLENALEISKETEHQDLEESACNFLCNLHVYLKLGQHDKAREYKELLLKRVNEAGPMKITRPLRLLDLLRFHCGFLPDSLSIEEELRISSGIIRLYESEREPLNDEYKISIADIPVYISVYKWHCFSLIILG